jgi:serine phosphatase RsbU (regulator of sigma subunit)
LREIVLAYAGEGCAALHDAILEAVTAFIGKASQGDDITLLVVEYCPETGG